MHLEIILKLTIAIVFVSYTIPGVPKLIQMTPWEPRAVKEVVKTYSGHFRVNDEKLK